MNQHLMLFLCTRIFRVHLLFEYPFSAARYHGQQPCRSRFSFSSSVSLPRHSRFHCFLWHPESFCFIPLQAVSPFYRDLLFFIIKAIFLFKMLVVMRLLLFELLILL